MFKVYKSYLPFRQRLAHCALLIAMAGTLVPIGLLAAELEVEQRINGVADGNVYLPETLVQPVYPEAALSARQEGWVQVQFTVDAAGTVVDPQVVDHCVGATINTCVMGGDVFAQAALDAIHEFKFQARTENGSPRATPGVQYVFRFVLPAPEPATDQ